MRQTQNVKQGSMLEPRLRLQSCASPTKTFKGRRTYYSTDRAKLTQ